MTEGGTEGTDTIMHIEMWGKRRGKDHGAFLQEIQHFLLHRTPTLPH